MSEKGLYKKVNDNWFDGKGKNHESKRAREFGISTNINDIELICEIGKRCFG